MKRQTNARADQAEHRAIAAEAELAALQDSISRDDPPASTPAYTVPTATSAPKTHETEPLDAEGHQRGRRRSSDSFFLRRLREWFRG